MDKLSKELMKKTDSLYARIEKKRDIIVLYEMLNKKNKKYSVIFNIQVIINHCLQCGNYLRACRYVIAAEKLLSDFEKNEKKIKGEVTRYFVRA